jgi:hypothetical protein
VSVLLLVGGALGGAQNDNQCQDEDNDRDHESEHVDYTDASTGTTFHSTQLQSAVFDDVAHSLTVRGTGTDNGTPVTFTMVAVDNGATTRDTFSLVLSDGYNNKGTLLDGAIPLH